MPLCQACTDERARVEVCPVADGACIAALGTLASLLPAAVNKLGFDQPGIRASFDRLNCQAQAGCSTVAYASDSWCFSLSPCCV